MRVAVLLFFAMAMQAATVQDALGDLYNFDFTAARRALDQYISTQPDDPLGYAILASAHLFSELNRMQILESEFFEDDRKIIAKKKLRADTYVQDQFFATLQKTRDTANARLAKQPGDEDALFSLAVASGLEADYLALVEKHYVRSLSTRRQAQQYANQLHQIDPNFADAYISDGISEYLLGSLPFLFRWFVNFDGVEASKTGGVVNLERVAKSGRYFGPFARILLAIIQLREKRPAESERLLERLAQEYPRNPLFRKELQRVRGIGSEK